MAVWRTEGSDSVVGDRRVFFPLSNRGFAVSRAEKDQQIGFFFRKIPNQNLNFRREKRSFSTWNLVDWNSQKKHENFRFRDVLCKGPLCPKSRGIEEKCGLSSLIRMQFHCKTRLNLSCLPQRENCSPGTPNQPLFEVNWDVYREVYPWRLKIDLPAQYTPLAEKIFAKGQKKTMQKPNAIFCEQRKRGKRNIRPW